MLPDAWRLAHGEDAVGDGPFGWGLVLGGDPLVEVLAVEEDDCVGGRRGVGGAGCDDRRDGLVDFGVLMLWARLAVVRGGRRRRRSGSRGLRKFEDWNAHDFHGEIICPIVVVVGWDSLWEHRRQLRCRDV